MASAFGGEGLKEGLTIADALRQQRDWAATQPGASAAEQAEAAAADPVKKSKADALREAVAVSVTKKSFEPANRENWEFQDRITFDLLIENKTDKDVAGVKGTLRFNDIFGDLIVGINLSIDDGVAAHASTTWSGQTDFNEFMDSHQRLRSTPLDKLHAVWDPDTIVFADGTKLSVNE